MILDHSVNVGFGMDLYSVVSDAFDIAIDSTVPVHIAQIVDDVGYAITSGDSENVRVDVYPPGVDEDHPGGFCRLWGTGLGAEQAHIASVLLMVAAEYLKFLVFEIRAGS